MKYTSTCVTKWEIFKHNSVVAAAAESVVVALLVVLVVMLYVVLNIMGF